MQGLVLNSDFYIFQGTESKTYKSEVGIQVTSKKTNKCVPNFPSPSTVSIENEMRLRYISVISWLNF